MNQITRHTPRWLQNDVFGSHDPRFLWPVSRLHQFSDGVLTVSIPRDENRSRIESRRIAEGNVLSMRPGFFSLSMS